MSKTSIYRDVDGYWLLVGGIERGPFATLQDAEDVRDNPPPPAPDEEIYHASDRPSTVREQYEAAWAEKQSLRTRAR